MALFRCPKCNKYFKMSYFEWLFTAVFHTFTKRLTKCPICGKRSWIGRYKENR